MIETMRALVRPEHCDQFLHMNTRHYMSMFDDAGPHLMFALGYSMERDADSGLGWADIEQTISYKREVRVGGLISIRSKPVSVNRKALSYAHSMINLTDGEEVATLTGTMLCFDLKLRKARLVPEDIATRCKELGAQIDTPQN